MAIVGMNHFTVLASDLDATLHFYCDLLGLRKGPRPPFGFPGAWLYSGNRAVLHVVAGRPLPQPPAGVIDHMAFTAQGLADTVAMLERHQVRHDLRQLPGDGTWQLFFHDPDGAKVELDFDASEAAPSPRGA
jgi:catechol 2,3-dioxygenase-like lactoylglutathione lyase family enzyme